MSKKKIRRDPASTSNDQSRDPNSKFEATMRAALKAGGALDTSLTKTRTLVERHPEAASLYTDLVQVVDGMRRSYGMPSTFDTDPESVEPSGRDEATPSARQLALWELLEYCVWIRGDQTDRAEELEEHAIAEYRRESGSYDLLLGGFLPKRLRNIGREEAVNNYFRGSNPTAYYDAGVFFQQLQDREQSRPGVSTGLPALDRALHGLRGLTMLGGAPGVGKTALVLSCALEALQADQNLGVVLFSLDMPKTTIYQRILSWSSGVPRAIIIGGETTQEQATSLKQAQNNLRKNILSRIRVVDWLDPPSKDHPSLLIEKYEEFRRSSATTRLLVVVDLFQKIPVRSNFVDLQADEYRLNRLEDLRVRTQSSANPTGCPMIAVSQIRKADGTRSEPTYDDLRGSARLAYDADNILLLSQDIKRRKTREGTSPLVLRVEKTRDGICTDIRLDFEFQCGKFAEASMENSEPTGSRTKPNSRPAGPHINPLAGRDGAKRRGN